MEVGSFEAKQRLSELIRYAQQGGKVTINVRGKPAALLVPPTPSPHDASAALDALIAFGKRRRLSLPKGETLRTLIEEGRR